MQEVTIIEPTTQAPSYELKLYDYNRVFRVLDFDIRFGIVSETKLAFIMQTKQTDIPKKSPYLCFYSRPDEKDISYASSIYDTVKIRLLTFKDLPARSDEFNTERFLSCETMAHKMRFNACFEKDAGKRKILFEEAYSVYEGVLLATCHSSIMSILADIRKKPKKSILFQPNSDLDDFNQEWRRFMSHCFAGMAICSLLGSTDHKRYVSLVSASLCCEVKRPLELVSSLRMIPFLMSNGTFLSAGFLARLIG
jgi:hypothetical protein